MANGLLPRKDRRCWQVSDFTSLIKPPTKWKVKITNAKEWLISAFCGKKRNGGIKRKKRNQDKPAVRPDKTATEKDE